MKKSIVYVLMLVSFIASFSSGYLLHGYLRNVNNDNQPQSEYEKVIFELEHGIKMAQARGDYRCCIEPACTMCYLEANKWNNFTPGTCACDDLAAQGRETCPQCEHSLNCEGGEDFRGCEINDK